MTTSRTTSLTGTEGTVHVQIWAPEQPTHLVLLAHGYGEHIGRYDHVAAAFAADGAAVYGPDHIGHGRSAGDRAVVEDMEHVVDDLHAVATLAWSELGRLPTVLVGHSMGGLIAARYAQRHGDGLAGLVLSGPAVGDMSLLASLLDLPEIPEIPIDPAVLSRDEAVGAAYAEDPLVWHGPFQRPTIAAMVSAQRAVADGPGFDLPLLWVHGSDDQLVPLEPARETVERLAGDDFTARVYPGARHEIYNETNRDEVIAETARFVTRVAASG